MAPNTNDDDDSLSRVPYGGGIPLNQNRLALDRLNDIADFEVEHVVYERSTRIDHFLCAHYFFSHHPGKDVEVGRRRARLLLAELLTQAVGRPAYGGDADTFEGDPPEGLELLVAKDRLQWEDMEADFIKLRMLLLRKDATVNYMDTADIERNGHEVDLQRAKNKVFGKRFDHVIQLCKIHKAMAPIRKELEDMIDAGVRGIYKKIDRSDCQDILEFAAALDDQAVEDTVKGLFEENEPTLLQVDETLIENIRTRPWSLDDTFQNKVEQLLQSMFAIVYPEPCELMKARYTIPEDSELAKVIETPLRNRRNLAQLRRFRRDLDGNHRDDPLVESLHASRFAAISRPQRYTDRQAVRGDQSKQRRFPFPSPNEKPRLAALRQLRPDPPNSDEMIRGRSRLEILEDNESEEFSTRARLSPTSPPRRYSADAGTSRRARNTPDDTSQRTGGGRRRIPWSDEEKNSVILGVEKFGRGAWREIKDYYDSVLRGRTNVQIKDCWRTLVNQRKLDPLDFPSAQKKPRKRTKKKKPQSDVDDDEEEETEERAKQPSRRSSRRSAAAAQQSDGPDRAGKPRGDDDDDDDGSSYQTSRPKRKQSTQDSDEKEAEDSGEKEAEDSGEKEAEVSDEDGSATDEPSTRKKRRKEVTV